MQTLKYLSGLSQETNFQHFLQPWKVRAQGWKYFALLLNLLTIWIGLHSKPNFCSKQVSSSEHAAFCNALINSDNDCDAPSEIIWMPRFLPSLHLFTSIQLRKTIIKSTVSISISAETASWGFPTYAQKPHYFVALSDYTYLRPVNEYSVRFELLPMSFFRGKNLNKEICQKNLQPAWYWQRHWKILIITCSIQLQLISSC